MNIKNTKKTVRGLLILFILFSISFASCHVVDPCDCEDVRNNDYSAKESFSYEIDVIEQDEITFSLINSEVNIVGNANISEVQILGEKCVKSDNKADAELHLAELQVNVRNRINSVEVSTEQPSKSYGRTYSVSYNVIIPDHWNVIINNVNGELIVEKLTGDIYANQTNGNISLDKMTGHIHVALVNGNVECDLVMPHNGVCNMETVNGEIKLEIPKTTSAKLNAGVVNGSVSVSGIQLTNMQSSGKSISGTMGSGNGNISLKAVNGNIKVSGKN